MTKLCTQNQTLISQIWFVGLTERESTHKAGSVQFLSSGQVSDVLSIVVDALHAAFEVSSTS